MKGKIVLYCLRNPELGSEVDWTDEDGYEAIIQHTRKDNEQGVETSLVRIKTFFSIEDAALFLSQLTCSMLEQITYNEVRVERHNPRAA